MAKLSISIPDALADDLRAAARNNVSAFISAAVRHELDRRRLSAFLDELEDELGPADEDEIAAFNAAFSQVAATKQSSASPGGKVGSGGSRQRSAS